MAPRTHRNGKLTGKQERFIEEYLIDLNATQAAIRAGYSVRTATAIGSENLRKPHVLVALQDRRQQLADEAGITPERVIAEYARLAFASITDVVSWNEKRLTVVPSAALSEAAAAAVKKVRATVKEMPQEDGEPTAKILIEVEMHDKKAALDSLAKTLHLFGERGGGERPTLVLTNVMQLQGTEG